MSRRGNTPHLCITALLCAMTPATFCPGQETEPGANHSVEIRESGASGFVGPPAPTTFEAPTHEQTPLGAPNGILSTRPVADDDAARWTSWVDPRENDTARVVVALCVVLGLLLLLRAAAKRMGRGEQTGRPSGVLEVLARYPIARNQQIVLLKVARRVVVAHLAGQSMTPISEFDEPDEVAQLLSRLEAGSRGKQAARFKRLLSRFEADHHAAPETEWGQHLESIKPQAVVDLTRGSSRGLAGILSGRRASA